MKYDKAFILADLHVPHYSKEVFSIAKKIIKDEKPTHLILLGDMIDCEHISKFSVKDIDSGLINTTYELDKFRSLLDELKDVLPVDSKIIWTLGNHEDRIQHILEKFQTKGLFEKYKYWKHKLNLKRLFPEVKILPYNEVYGLGKLNYTHGIYHNDFHTKKHAVSLTKNIIYGHLHSHQVYTLTTPNQEFPRQAIAMGCACKLDMPYMRSKPSTWLHQLGIVNYRERGEYTLFTPTIINGRTTYNNTEYKG
jgi:predicted phosphodiesterase